MTARRLTHKAILDTKNKSDFFSNAKFFPHNHTPLVNETDKAGAYFHTLTNPEMLYHRSIIRLGLGTRNLRGCTSQHRFQHLLTQLFFIICVFKPKIICIFLLVEINKH